MTRDLDHGLGPGKRRWGELEEAESSEPLVPRTKVQKTSASSSLRSSKASSSRQGAHIPRGRITKANIEAVRDQLSNLTIKNQEIKSSIHAWRKTLVDELFNHMRVRNIALSQLGRRDVDEEMRNLCLEALRNRKNLMVAREDELLHLERLLSGHAAVLEFADSAYSELVEKVKIFEELASRGQEPGLSMLDFPHMSKLARLTGGEHKEEDVLKTEILQEETPSDPVPFSSFTKFSSLPAEIRLEIWRATIPGSRIITHSSVHNAAFALLSTCRESRAVVLSATQELLSPPPKFPQATTPVLYIFPAIDTVVRDLTLPEPRPNQQGNPTTSIFGLSDQEFNHAVFGKLTGAARVQHLALAFDLLNENGGVLFGALQSCCPSLSTLILFPSSQFRCRPRRQLFLTLDSNVLDYVYSRHSMLSSRKLRKKALRGLYSMLTLANHAQQYMEVFPSYVRNYGRDWEPFMRVCLLLYFNERSQSWHSGALDGDIYSKGYIGDDGRLYKGFIESLKLADHDGELFSRYDGIQALFEDGENS